MFLVSVVLVGFVYFGYPLSLVLASRLAPKHVAKASVFPPVSLIITAFNEESRIREKLENTLTLEYPKESLQVIVASDGSTDATNSIVEEYANHGIELLPVRERGGKENAQREAVQIAEGEILVFSDVATRLDVHGLKEIVSNFADPTVGCVSSVDRVLDKEGRSCGEGAYVRYEMWLRSLETAAYSLVGLSGSFFAARREVCADFSDEMQSDFRTLLNSMRQGLRGVSDPAAVGYYLDVGDSRREFSRKVRTVLRGLTVFFRNLEFLNPFRYGIFSYQYLCHKLLRWLVPFFMLTALVSNLALLSVGWLFSLFFVLQVLFYTVAGLTWVSGETPRRAVLKIPTYFVTANVAIGLAWWQYFCGRRMVMWTPTRR